MGYIKKYKPILTEEEKKYIRAEQNKKYYYKTHKPVKAKTLVEHEEKLKKIFEVRNKRKITLKIIPDPADNVCCPEPIVVLEPEPIVVPADNVCCQEPAVVTTIGETSDNVCSQETAVIKIYSGKPRGRPRKIVASAVGDNVSPDEINQLIETKDPVVTIGDTQHQLIDILNTIKTQNDLDIVKNLFLNDKKI